jgi:hypothetical protein
MTLLQKSPPHMPVIGKQPVAVEGDFGPVRMTLDRSEHGVLRVHIRGEGGHADAALRRWRYNFEQLRIAGLHKLLVVLEFTGPMMTEAGFRRVIDGVADLELSDLRIAVVQTRLQRQRQDELSAMIAIESGIRAAVFSDEPSALLWLRHGER